MKYIINAGYSSADKMYVFLIFSQNGVKLGESQCLPEHLHLITPMIDNLISS